MKSRKKILRRALASASFIGDYRSHTQPLMITVSQQEDTRFSDADPERQAKAQAKRERKAAKRLEQRKEGV